SPSSRLAPTPCPLPFPYTTLFRSKRVFDNRDAETTERVESIVRAATFVPDTKPANDLLREMQSEHIHVAIVVEKVIRRFGVRHRSEEHTSELQSRFDLVCRLPLEK